MGAFCIYGISRSICKATANKKTSFRDSKENRDLTPGEWAARRDAVAEQLFNEATRRVRVSPELDSPHFCRDWLAADPTHVRDTVLMVRGPKRDKKGDIVVKNGVPVETWVEYAAECERQKIEPVKLDGLT